MSFDYSLAVGSINFSYDLIPFKPEVNVLFLPQGAIDLLWYPYHTPASANRDLPLEHDRRLAEFICDLKGSPA